MIKKLSILLILGVALLSPSIVAAQGLSLFAKQKVIIADIIDRNDREINPAVKNLIYQGFRDVIANSSDYEVFEVNIDEIKANLKANNTSPTPENICKSLGDIADFILFTEIRTSASAYGSQAQNVTIFLSASSFRIKTATYHSSAQGQASADEKALLVESSAVMARLLDLKVGGQESVKPTPVATIPSNATAENAYSKGKELYDQKCYEESYSCFKSAAEQGHIGAQYYLGRSYEFGRGVERNYYEAVKWYRKAAEKGDAKAQNSLGLAYAKGRGVEQDDYEAVKWYRKAAEQGLAIAQSNLAHRYSSGKGVEQDDYEAVKWYRKAAEQGNANAQNNLGLAYARGKGVEQDYYEAVKWYRKAAEQGNANAQNNLAGCYKYGRGVEQDYNEAVKWYRKAAEKGHSNAQNNLGLCYLDGNGVERNYYEAVRCFQLAATKKNKYGYWNLGRCYENGWGVQKNKSEAVEWYRKAAERGHTGAKEKLNKWGY